jgi:exodeoxyribonuclease V alpha subunit
VIRRLLEARPPAVDRDRLRRGLADAFPDGGQPDWQRVAAAMAVLQRFCIISGGPGTGKTWTLARILGLLRDQPEGEHLRIALAAPTGKAAARMVDSILRQRAEVDTDEETRRRIPEHAGTLHRLLGRWLPKLRMLKTSRRVRWSLDVDPADTY